MDSTVDAWVVLGTKLDSKQFEKDLKSEIREMERLTKESESLTKRKIKLKVQLDESYSKEIEKIKEMYNAELEGFGENGTPLTEVGLERINKRYQDQLDQVNAKYSTQIANLEDINKKIRENATAQELMKTKIEETSDSLVKQRGLEQTENHMKEMSKHAGDFTKKILRAGLAIFGIRSAYLGIRRVISGVLSQNEELKKQMDGMMNSLYAAFTPIVEKIINLIKTLMAYVNYIWNRLFGHDLFKNSVKSSAQTAKNAKEINKQLASFDEANVLSDNKSSGSGSGGGSTDLGLANIKIPDWLKKIMDWVDEHPKLAKIIFGLAAFTLFGGWKLAGGILKTITTILGGGAGAGATGLIGILGTLALIAGTVWVVYLAYKGVKEAYTIYKDLKHEQGELKDGIESLGEKTRENNKDWLDHAAVLEKGTDERKKYIDGVMKNIEIDKRYAGIMKDNKDAQKQYKKTVWETAEKFEELRRETGLTEEESYQYYKMLRDNLTPEEYAMWEALQATKDALTGTKNGFDKLDKQFKTKYLIEVTSSGLNTLKDSLTNLGNTFKTIFNTSGLQDLFNKLGIGNALTSVKNKFKNLFKYDAMGGIVSLPGRGVPLHMVGEAGREGIIPMDNQQQMALLGREIAKYVNINNVVNNYMDARKINSILKQSETKEKLANNG